MKKIVTLISAVLLTVSLSAQAPQSFSYQAVVRGANNSLVSNKPVGMKISLLQGSENGNAVYEETHTPTSNDNGLVSIAIGAGNVVNGVFTSIDWSKGPYFVKTETDITGGTNYTITTISELLSVPNALFAANSQPGPKGDTGAVGSQGSKGEKGEKGDTGAQGPIGLTGEQGPKGETGFQGLKGDKGDIGLTGVTGPSGTDGKTVLSGTIAPISSYGVNGDFYINTTTYTIYGPKSNGVWPTGISMVGPKGDIGLKGATGPQGPAGIFPEGSVKGEMKYWDGTTWNTITPGNNGQGLTYCDGIPTWTTGGICPGKISTLDCTNATNNGTLTATTVASGVTCVISYTGGNSGAYTEQTLTSTGVTGLTATLVAGNFVQGNGSLTYTIIGTPETSGTANFMINIGGKACSISVDIEQILVNSGPNIIDVDSNSYKTVYIGTQQWMAENLKVSKYNDGTVIPNIADSDQWVWGDTPIEERGNFPTQLPPAWVYYNNDSSNNAKYGKLYNWFVIDPERGKFTKNVCPSGWHVPTKAEWTVLTDYLGGNDIAGGKMKEVGTLNCFPAGYRTKDGPYLGLGKDCYLWSSTPSSVKEASYMNVDTSTVDYIYKKYAMPIRCLKD